MDLARPSQKVILLSLQDTASTLGVSVETLREWSEHHILTPKIKEDGTIGYSKDEIVYFQSIKKSFQEVAYTSQSPRKDIIGLPKPNSSPHEKTTLKKIDFSQVLTVILFGGFVFLIVLLVKGPQIFSYINGIALYQNQLTTETKVVGQQTSKLPFHTTSSDAGPVNLTAQVKTNTLQKSDSNTQFSFVWPDKNEKPKVSTRSGQVLAKSVTNLSNASQLLKNSSSKMATIASQTQTNYASTLSPNTDDDTSRVRLDLGTFTIPNNIKNDTILPVAAVGIVGILWLFFQSQLAFSDDHPQRVTKRTSTNSANEERIIELEQKMDGSVVVLFQGKEYKICKPELYSDSDQFIERLMELTVDEKEIEYDSFTDSKLRLSTPLSRIVTRLNFVGLKRDLFFPRTSKNRVLFRRFISYQDLMTMNLTVNNVLSDLTKVA